MKKIRSVTVWILLLSMLVSLYPLQIGATEAQSDTVFFTEPLSEEKAETKAVSVSSISVPTYSGGTASSWMVYDGGDSISYHDGETQSKMQIIKGTTATQFNTYCTKLTNNGT